MMVEHPEFRQLCTVAQKRGLVVELHGARGPVPPEGRPVPGITRLKVLSDDRKRVLASHATNLNGLDDAARFAQKELTAA